MEMGIERFQKLLDEALLPAFCLDQKRQLDPAGFQQSSVRISQFDAENFRRAIDNALVTDKGGGRYYCHHKTSFEQLFWEGEKIKPGSVSVLRKITLWLEPVITMATVARLRLDLGWPERQIGMQSKGYAFDLVAYDGDAPDASLILAVEVKKSPREIDSMLAYLHDFASSPPTEEIATKDKRRNAYKKWVALCEQKPRFFWAVGPDDYTSAFELHYNRLGHPAFTAVGLDRLQHQAAGGSGWYIKDKLSLSYLSDNID